MKWKTEEKTVRKRRDGKKEVNYGNSEQAQREEKTEGKRKKAQIRHHGHKNSNLYKHNPIYIIIYIILYLEKQKENQHFCYSSPRLSG